MMSLGKAAVWAVFLPIAFGALLDLTGARTAPVMRLFVLVAVMTVRMHVAIRRMDRRRRPALAEERYLSDMPDKPVETPGFDGPRTANAPRPHRRCEAVRTGPVTRRRSPSGPAGARPACRRDNKRYGPRDIPP